MDMGERPDDSLESSGLGRPRAFLSTYVAVIKIDELVAKRLAEDQPGDCREENANAEDQPAIVRPAARCRMKARRFSCDGAVPRFLVIFDLRLIRLPHAVQPQ